MFNQVLQLEHLQLYLGAFTIVSGGTGYTSTTPVTITQTGATASSHVATVSAAGTKKAISGGTSSGFSYFTTPPVMYYNSCCCN